MQINPLNKDLPSLLEGMTASLNYAIRFVRTGINSGRELTTESIGAFIEGASVSDFE